MSKHIQKQFIDDFRKLTHSVQRWQAWGDFVAMAAISISNAVNKAYFDEREARYLELIKKYDPEEQRIFSKLYAYTVAALDENPAQDFLGDLFMQLELANHWKGQFFTPYHVSQLMAEIQTADSIEKIQEKGFISVSDPACGAGALLIAYANSCRDQGINYQIQVQFVAQDIDYMAAMMCYIQLSLLGCPGYVVVGDTLTQPITGDLTSRDVWYTPFYFSDVWHFRRLMRSIGHLLDPVPERKPQLEELPSTLAVQQLTLF